MTRKSSVALLSLFLIAFLAVSAFGANQWAKGVNTHIPANLKATTLKAELAGDDDYYAPVVGEEGNYDDASVSREGFLSDDGSAKAVVVPGPAVGQSMGFTTYDYQHNSRMTRQVAWYGDDLHYVHFAWMKKNNDVDGAGTYRMTAYQYWNTAGAGNFGYSTTTFGGGKDVHTNSQRSGYAGIDVLPVNVGGTNEGRAVVYNHFDLTGGIGGDLNYLPTLWPDFNPRAGNFGPYNQDVPAPFLTDCISCEYIWPYVATQVLSGGDTVIHIITTESIDGGDAQEIRYFRRVGPVGIIYPAAGVAWTGMVVDTTPAIATVVEPAPVNAPNRNKVAIVWAAHWPAVPGGGESTTPQGISLQIQQNMNDVYAMISNDGGATWGADHNVSRIDSTVGGFCTLGDISAMIDTQGRLHVVWSGRPTGGLAPGATGANAVDWDWPLYPVASRIYHAVDTYFGNPNEESYITVVKDGTWDWITEDDESDDTTCTGGAWHSMALNQPQISQCDNKLYVMFSQLQDYDNGIWDNCHVRNWTEGEFTGSANGLLFFSVSTMANGGLNWDPARPLTGYTRRCDTAGNPGGVTTICHSHFWPSMARYGMEVDPVNDDFTNAVVVKSPSWVHTSSNFYLDVQYIDDLNPGGIIQGEGAWTYNPVKWLRIPCVEPVPQPVLAIDPIGVFTPQWNKPGVAVPVDVTMFNIGNAALTVNSIVKNELEGPVAGWLHVNQTSAAITEAVPNNFDVMTVTINNGGVVNAGLAPAVLRGNVVYTWETSRTTTFPIEFIVADTVQFPTSDTLLTNHIGLAINNAGGMGLGLRDSSGQMDFHTNIECDNCYRGANNLSEAYLFDASPFILRQRGNDTLVSAYVHSHTWLSEHPDNYLKDGFRPLNTMSYNPMAGTLVNKAFNIELTNKFVTADSTIALEITHYAPKLTPYNYMGHAIKVYNISGAAINDIYVGQIEDWDIPSDSGTRNGSGYDFGRRLMYQFGWETEVGDTFCGGENDCADADKRFGGSSFIAQFTKPGGATPTKSTNLHGMFTGKTTKYLGGGHLQYDTLLAERINAGWSGFDLYTDPNPDSTFMDLLILALFGKYNLGVNDTLVFMKVMVSEYQDAGIAPNPTTFLTSVDNARKGMKKAGACCRAWGFPGDVTSGTAGVGNHALPDVLDILYIINFKFKSGPTNKWPEDGNAPTNGWNCESLMDCNADGAVDVLDILYLIDWKFKASPNAPKCPF